ncbi:MAG: NUDIX hydrolase [Propionibacteriales bacterium]|nr:NUDIX hydrolase [Propionibacteriales bacterium]
MSLALHPSLPGLIIADGAFGDVEHSWPVTHSESPFTSPYLVLSIDTIADPNGEEHARTVVRPNGAVGIVALDDADRILLVEQYRHPVRRRLLEIPAGTLDVAGESSQRAAARELSEEADICAVSWNRILNLYATPGYSTEGWEVFLASGLSPTPVEDRTTRVAEEADMRQLWVPFSDALGAVFEARIADSMTVAAILATDVLRRADR